MLAAVPSSGLDIRWRVLASTLGWALGIGALATLAALPIALATRGLSARWSPLVVLPLVMPMPLVYAGLNLFRAPGTALGDWLAMGPSWRAIAAGRVVAVVGLALWATPIAAAVLGAGVRSVARSMPEAAALDGAGPVRRLAITLRAIRSGVVAAVAIVAIVMTGSAIPLHLAQINTYSIVLWLELDAASAGDSGRVWFAATPVLAVAVLGAALLAATITRRAGASDDPAEPPGARLPASALAVAVLACGSVVPLLLFARELTTLQTFGVLWRTEQGAILQSAAVAAGVGAAGAILAWCTRVAVAAHPRVVAIGLTLLLTTALAPGVLVGAAVADAWSHASRVAGSPLILMLAHLARLGALAALLGVLIAAAEPAARRDARRLEGATGLLTSLRASGDAAFAGAAGLILAAMSLGEIEASIMVQPPGGESVARSMLNMLHFARYEHLSGLVLLVAAPAGLLGGLAWILIVLSRTVHRRGTFR